jgi:hypothetical protein
MNALVMPHPGQGIPVRTRKTQSEIGESSIGVTVTEMLMIARQRSKAAMLDAWVAVVRVTTFFWIKGNAGMSVRELV